MLLQTKYILHLNLNYFYNIISSQDRQAGAQFNFSRIQSKPEEDLHRLDSPVVLERVQQHPRRVRPEVEVLLPPYEVREGTALGRPGPGGRRCLADQVSQTRNSEFFSQLS
jgi:hypothetical protein